MSGAPAQRTRAAHLRWTLKPGAPNWRTCAEHPGASGDNLAHPRKKTPKMAQVHGAAAPQSTVSNYIGPKFNNWNFDRTEPKFISVPFSEPNRNISFTLRSRRGQFVRGFFWFLSYFTFFTILILYKSFILYDSYIKMQKKNWSLRSPEKLYFFWPRL